MMNKKVQIMMCTMLLIFNNVAFAQNDSDYVERQIKITTLNAEWLSCSTNGPSDEGLQMRNIAKAIRVVNPDIIALQEVGTSSSYATIDTLVKLLGSAWAGAIAPWSANNCSQNQGIIYKKANITLTSSSLVRNGGSSKAWSSGRFPALYNVTVNVGGRSHPISVFDIHAKATTSSSDASDDYSRRKSASEGLKALLDETYKYNNVVIIGDYNDYLEGRQCNRSGCPSATTSPYKNFVDDVNNYTPLTIGFSNTIDHIIVSNELSSRYVSGSARRETQVLDSIPNYRNTTSDHTPVSMTLKLDNTTAAPKTSYSSQLLLYPTPTEHTLNVESGSGSIASVSVCNMNGTVVYEQKGVGAPHLSIATTSWKSGLYIVTVRSEKGEVGSKMVLKN